MNILLIHQYFKTPEEGGGIRSWHIAKSWVERGHKVTVLTASNTRSGLYRIKGIEVEYFPIRYENSFGFIKRVRAFIRFLFACKSYLRYHHGFELAYVLTTPLTTAFIALHVKNTYGIPYVFEVGDLWPRVPIELGIIKNPLIKKYLQNLEKNAYQASEKLVALSPAIKEHIQHRVPDKEIAIIPNMSDCDFFNTGISYTGQDPLKICYFGAISYANHLEFLLEAAETSQKQEIPLEFHLMGFGGLKKKIQSLSSHLKNIHWHEEGGMNHVRELLHNCHATYISYLDHPVLNTGSPNKLFDGLASGHLIILNFDGWIRELIEEHKCGFSYDPLAPEEFVEKISKYIQSPEMIANHQKRSRKLAENQFEVNTLTHQLNKFLDLN